MICGEVMSDYERVDVGRRAGVPRQTITGVWMSTDGSGCPAKLTDYGHVNVGLRVGVSRQIDGSISAYLSYLTDDCRKFLSHTS
ncbi:hypothetical protein F511_29992 [Dorcoceras hygrometricum]|uniref:Uncharacterized protein n=1 Tax=Dorcoceras hygrometricum TaxID=472368 RepID=A0A2Z7CZD9_9LAMI|nr:hypothetical protein F511_29992 [Dorcoceras hygrometricum]